MQSQVQQQLLLLYKQVSETFQREKITFFTVGGTTIGAVRHHGFIPWDDDMDLAMTRIEFQKFTLFAQQENNCGNRFKIILPENENSPYQFAKIFFKDNNDESVVDATNGMSGVFIDIFPLDQMPMDTNKRMTRFREFKYVNHAIMVKNGNDNNKKNKHKFISKLIVLPILGLSIHQLKRIRYRIATASFNTESTMYFNLGGPYQFDKDLFIFSEISEVRWVKFEDTEIPIPVGYDLLLRRTYGDYMKLPPEAARIAPHLVKSH